MIQTLLKIYERIFSKTYFYKLNKFLFVASSKGLGFDSDAQISDEGESRFLDYFFNKYASINNPVIFDVGANVGHYSTKIKQMCPHALIYAFEPHPVTFKTLEAISNQKDFNAINKGCGETNGTIKFYDYSDVTSSEHATMLKGVLEDIHHAKSTEYEVAITTIDAFASLNEVNRIHLLKIDTEGYEFSVLKGCENLLLHKKIDIIHFEFNSMNMISRVYLLDFVKLLKGYQFYRIISNGMIPIEMNNHLLSEVFVFQNIVAIKD